MPLRAITVIGMVTFLGCIGITLWAIVIRLFTQSAIPGWASTVLPIYTLGALQITTSLHHRKDHQGVLGHDRRIDAWP